MTLDTEGRQGGREFGVVDWLEDVLSAHSSGSWLTALRRQRGGEEKRQQIVAVSGHSL